MDWVIQTDSFIIALNPEFILYLMKLNKLLLSIVFTIAISVLMGTQNAFANTTTDAGDIPGPSQTVDFSQFAGVFDCSGALIGPNSFCFTTGPVQIGVLVFEDIDWSSTSSGSVIGNADYGLGSNGEWDSGRDGYVGTNTGANTVVMRFDFNDGAVCAVGGFVNYSPGVGDPFTITALDNGNAVLETFDVSTNAPITTPGATNDGAFRGIVRASNDIAAIELTGEFDVLDDLKFSRNCGVVGGEFLPIDNTALVLAGLQTSAIWMLPVLAGAAGAGAYYIKTRMNKDKNLNYYNF